MIRRLQIHLASAERNIAAAGSLRCDSVAPSTNSASAAAAAAAAAQASASAFAVSSSSRSSSSNLRRTQVDPTRPALDPSNLPQVR